MNIINRGIRNAFRNTTRTISIVVILGLAVALALTMLLARQAVTQKINSVKSSVGTTITVAPAGFNGFSQVNNALTTSQLSKVKSLPHVTSVSESLNDRLATTGTTSGPIGQNSSSGNTTSLTSPVTLNSNGGGSFSGGRFGTSSGGSFSLPANFSLPITVEGTNDPSQLNGSTLKITSGQLIDGTKDSNDALISTDMASKNSLKVGSTFTAYNATLTVAGIFDSGSRGGNDTVIVSLPALERLSDQSGVVTSAVVTVDSLDNLSGTTTSVKSILGSTADVTNAQDQANTTVQPLESIRKVSLYSLIGAVAAGAVIIFLTMLMIVRERRREIGVLKAIGASNLRVSLQFMAEAVTLTILAAIIGGLIAVAAADPVTRTLVNNSTSDTSSGQTATTTASGQPPGPGGGNFSFRVRDTTSGNGPNFVAQGRGIRRVGSDFSNIKAAIGWSLAAYGLAAALLIAIVGSGIASWSIAKIRPAEVMRTE